MRTSIGAILLTLAIASPASATLTTEAPPYNDHPVSWAKKVILLDFAGFTENSPYLKVRCWFTRTDRGGDNRYKCKALYIGDRLNARLIVKEKFADDVVVVWFSHIRIFH